MMLPKVAYKKIIYHWIGKNAFGRPTKGTIEAASLNSAKFYLQQQDIQITNIKKKFALTNGSFTYQETALFFQQLATLITTGIPLVQSCEIMTKHNTKPHILNLLSFLIHSLNRGNGLGYGLQHCSIKLSPFVLHLVTLGERTGNLEKALFKIAEHQESIVKIRTSIRQALLYPSFLIVIAIIIFLLVLIIIVPRFADLYLIMQHDLPVLSRNIFHLSTWLRKNYFSLLLTIATCISFTYFILRFNMIKNLAKKLCLATPGAGYLIKILWLSRFSKSLAIALSAGLPIVDSLKLMEEISTISPFLVSVKQLQTRVAAGHSLNYAMAAQSMFPEVMIQMIKIGEESGKLESMLNKIADIYQMEIGNWTTQLKQLLEPLIILIVGVLIGGLVVAMYLPIFQLGNLT